MDPPRRERSPGPLDFRSRNVCPTEKRRQPVESLDRDVTTMKPAAERSKRETVLGSDGIEGGFDPDDVQEPGEFADHRGR